MIYLQHGMIFFFVICTLFLSYKNFILRILNWHIKHKMFWRIYKIKKPNSISSNYYYFTLANNVQVFSKLILAL